MAEDVIDEVIQREGGFVDDPDDRGGATKYGITQATLAAWRARAVTAEEVAALTVEEARAIYKARYAPGMARIEHHVDLYRFLFDVSVLSGPTTAIRLLQGRLNALGARVDVDGVLGPKTALAVEAVAIPALLLMLVVERSIGLVRIVEKDLSQLKFLRGWMARTLSFLPGLP